MTSAFIIQVQPQLQLDPNDETAALLRVLIRKIDNTTFGNDPPALPQWTGPPRTIVQVQAILYASLAISLFSVFLTKLGKQWLNRYASIDMRGSATERNHNRQRKLDDVVTWYFGYVMQSLPVMLQLALLLVGCALSLYLWGIDTTVALVVLGITSFGVAFYTFIVIAGAVSTSCPYQTPGAYILHHIPPLILSMSHQVSSTSIFILLSVDGWGALNGIKCSQYEDLIAVMLIILTLPIWVPISLAIDSFILTRAMARIFIALAHRVVDGWFCSKYESHTQVTIIDLHCVTWMLQT